MAINYELIDKVLNEIFPLPKQFGVILPGWEEPELPDLEDLTICAQYADSYASIVYGLSKLVITSPRFNGVVIKIPFNGYYNEYEDEKTGELITHWRSFINAGGTAIQQHLNPTDYCLTECIKYNKLKTFALDCFAAKTTFYKTLYNVRIFLQEEVAASEDLLFNIRRPSKHSLDLANQWEKNKQFYMDTEWIANCLDIYGQSKVKRFIHYCSNIDTELLSDMHCGNYGYRKDKSPCLLDFSNFSD